MRAPRQISCSSHSSAPLPLPSAIGAEVDATGNSVLSTAVTDYNKLLLELGRTAVVSTRQTRSRAASEVSASGEGSPPAAAPAPSAGTRHMARIPYGRMLRAKDVARYSASDLSAVLGGSASAASSAPFMAMQAVVAVSTVAGSGRASASSSSGAVAASSAKEAAAPAAPRAAERRRRASSAAEGRAQAVPPQAEAAAAAEDAEARRQRKAARKEEKKRKRESGGPEA